MLTKKRAQNRSRPSVHAHEARARVVRLNRRQSRSRKNDLKNISLNNSKTRIIHSFVGAVPVELAQQKPFIMPRRTVARAKPMSNY